MDLVRFQVEYWRVSSGKKKSGVGGRCPADGRKTHTKMIHSTIPFVRSYLVMTDGGDSRKVPTRQQKHHA